MVFKKFLPSLLIGLAVLTAGLPAQAGMVGTAQMQDSALMSGSIDSSLQRNWIATQLQRGGVPQAQSERRVASMTDTEVAQIYQRIDQAPAGGADVLLIALVIFAVLEITGYIDVIPEMN